MLFLIDLTDPFCNKTIFNRLDRLQKNGQIFKNSHFKQGRERFDTNIASCTLQDLISTITALV